MKNLFIRYMKVVKILTLTGLLALIVSGILGSGCSGVAYRQELVDSLFLYLDDAEIYYDLKEPDRKYSLPYVLSEVSGVTFKNPANLLMIEDEGGVVYEMELENGEILGSRKFAAPGDFEDLELVGDTVYVMRSDGRIYKFPERNSTETTIINTPLTHKNNTEGLGFDPRLKKLLITTKESGNIETNKIDGKAIYGLSLKTGIMDEKELASISKDDLNTFFERVKNRKYEKEKFKFEPSAVAYNPIDKNYYVLASVGKLLLVINPSGEIVSSYPILPRILNQPEGICFSPEGDMFICSEGEGDRGFVLHFKMFRK